MQQAFHHDDRSHAPHPLEIDLDHELSQGFARTLIQRLVHRTANRLQLTREDREDFEQTLAMELARRANQFDPARGSWEAFAATLVQHKLKTEIHRLVRRWNHEPRASEDCRHLAIVEDDGPSLVDLKHDLQTLTERLTPEERRVFQEISETSVRSVSRHRNVCRRTLRDRLHRIRKRVSDHPLNENYRKRERIERPH